MDDGADLDLVDVSPIGSPDHSQITINQRWRGVEPYIDYETEHAAIFAVNSQYHCGTPQLSPHPRGLSKLNPSTLDMNPSPPFLYSPDYPSTIEGTPSPLSYTSDYLDFEDDSPLPSTKFDDDLRFNHYPNLLIYVRKIIPLNPSISQLISPIVNRIQMNPVTHTPGIPTTTSPYRGMQVMSPMRRSLQMNTEAT